MRFHGFFRRTVVAAALLTLSWGALGQESLVKAETLVRLQAIPLSRPMSFDQVWNDDELEWLALLLTKSLDSSPSWNSTAAGWDLYRINLRADLESTLRQRLASSNGTMRTLSQAPETSLAKHYADTLSEGELDQVLQFYQSAAGKKYLGYQRLLREAYLRGRLVFGQMRMDPAHQGVRSTAELQAVWLARHRLPPDDGTRSYAFHLKTLQPLYPSVSAQDLAFSLAAGAIPGSEAMRRLDTQFSADERAEVDRYLESPGATREWGAVREWSQKLGKQPELIPILLRDMASMAGLIDTWRKVRAEPNALPRSAARTDPAAVNVPDSLGSHPLDSSIGDRIKACIPSATDTARESFLNFVKNGDYLRFSRIMENAALNVMYVTRGALGACVRTTQAGYPILAPDSFAGTVVVTGMSDGEVLEWRQKMAQALATTGSATSLVLSSKGNAFEVNYAVQPRLPQILVYHIRFRPAGTYAESDYATVARPAHFRGISVTRTVQANNTERALQSVIATPEDIRRDQDTRNRP